jgi:hypothetical protein
VSGWQLSSRFDVASGIMAAFPQANYVRGALLEPNWHDPSGVVRLWRPCVARVQDQPGAPVQLENRAWNSQFGCTVDNYNWLMVPQYAPLTQPNFRSDFRRQPSRGIVNVGLNRNFRVRERYRFTLRVEAYNLLNRFVMVKGYPSADPNSSTFGIIVKKDTPLWQTFLARRVSGSLRFSF